MAAAGGARAAAGDVSPARHPLPPRPRHPLRTGGCQSEPIRALAVCVGGSRAIRASVNLWTPCGPCVDPVWTLCGPCVDP
eukprot:8255414-Pyramimonas_sp.AAC.1